jgi:acetylornithine deacetylase/succinyl-diaminopimelate desuccinylase-like protein
MIPESGDGDFGVRDDALIDLTQRLVRCASIGPGDELERSFTILDGYLRDGGVATEILRMGEGLPLLRCSVSGREPGPHLLFQGHLDVVPAGDGWEFDPFSGDVVDGMLRGRGSCDMKGGVAACAEVMCRLASSPERWIGSATLLVVPDEETGGEHGLLHYLDHFGVEGMWGGVCAEPTDLVPYLGNRGVIWADVRISGRSAHAGMPQLGSNPVPVAASIVTGLIETEWSGATPTPTTVHAGNETNTIPGEAVVGIDLRLSPGDDPQAAVAALERLVAVVRERHPENGLELEVKKVWPACLVDEGSKLAQMALQSARATNPTAEFGFDDASNDASFLSEAGVPTLVWGPGEPGLAHAVNERADVSQIIAAARMYLRFASGCKAWAVQGSNL